MSFENMKKSRVKKRICIIVEARAVYQRAPDGSLVKADVPPCVHTVSVPQTIEDIHQEALMSGAVIYPGWYTLNNIIFISFYNSKS